MEARFKKADSGNANTLTDFEDKVLFNISKAGDESRSPLHPHVELTELDPRSSKCSSIQDERFSPSRNKRNESSWIEKGITFYLYVRCFFIDYTWSFDRSVQRRDENIVLC